MNWILREWDQEYSMVIAPYVVYNNGNNRDKRKDSVTVNCLSVISLCRACVYIQHFISNTSQEEGGNLFGSKLYNDHTSKIEK